MAEDTVLTEEQNIKSMWTALQVAEGQIEKRGVQFGEAAYKLREKYKRPDGLRVSSETQNSFEAVCDRLGIIRSTAYRWIARYEESIGTRLPKPEPPEAESEPPEFEPEPEPTPAPPPASPPVSPEEKDRKQLVFLVKRLTSISKAIQQVVDDNARWSQYEEYDEVVSLGKKLAGLL
jgi:transposase-like protein